MDEDMLVSRGSGVTVKADGSVAGLLVRFGSSTTADTDDEFFTAKTDYGFDGAAEKATDVYYHHGLDPDVGLTRIGTGTLKMTDEGVWFSGQLDKRKKYVKRIMQLARTKGEDGAPVLGMSSGSAAHLVRYKAAENGTREIVSWPLGLDASLTPTPADPRTYVTALKSAKPAPTFRALCETYAIKSTKDDGDGDLDLSDAGVDDAPTKRHTGLLVALFPPADVAARLGVDGGEAAADLHVTLAYCGDAAELGPLAVAQAIVNVAECARSVPALAGLVNGVGRFSASATSDGMDVLYAAIDVPGLAGLRERVARYLSYAACPPRANHGWTPHCTLRYLDPADETPLARLEPVPVRFETVSVVYGDTRVDIPLGRDARAEAASLDYAKAFGGTMKGAFAEALAVNEASDALWKLWSAFQDALRELQEAASEGEVEDLPAKAEALVNEYAATLRARIATILGVAGEAAQKSQSEGGARERLSLDAQGTAALAAVKGLTERWVGLCEHVLAERATKVGAAMSGSRRQRANAIVAGLREHAETLERMVKECEPKPKGDDTEGAMPSVKTTLELLRLRNRAARARSRGAA